VASHASQFDLHAKRKKDDAYNPGVFADRTLYDKQLNSLEATYHKKVDKKQ
jgi:metallo-beta-lactamase class B